jgi:hypothetical protein
MNGDIRHTRRARQSELQKLQMAALLLQWVYRRHLDFGVRFGGTFLLVI